MHHTNNMYLINSLIKLMKILIATEKVKININFGSYCFSITWPIILSNKNFEKVTTNIQSICAHNKFNSDNIVHYF